MQPASVSKNISLCTYTEITIQKAALSRLAYYKNGKMGTTPIYVAIKTWFYLVKKYYDAYIFMLVLLNRGKGNYNPLQYLLNISFC